MVNEKFTYDQSYTHTTIQSPSNHHYSSTNDNTWLLLLTHMTHHDHCLPTPPTRLAVDLTIGLGIGKGVMIARTASVPLPRLETWGTHRRQGNRGGTYTPPETTSHL